MAVSPEQIGAQTRLSKDFIVKLLRVDAVVYLVDAYDKERFSESKKELDALLSDAASEDELRYHLGLANCTTGKGKVRPLEIFMCSIVRKMGYGEGFKWMSQYINPEED